MGYRSEVRCLIYGPPDKLNAMIVKHQLEGGRLLTEYFKDDWKRYKTVRTIYDAEASKATVDESGKGRPVWKDVEVEVLDLEGESWKWYPNYEDVKAWEAFMRGADEWGCSFEFVRVGEDQGDVEIERNILDDGYEWLSTSTTICCDVVELEESDDG